MSMGIRFVGKDPDGIAKAISVNDDGVLLVELLGSLLIGEVAENPTANTLLARLKSLEDKIDKITNGTTPAVTQLSGSLLELYGAGIGARPLATAVTVGTIYEDVTAQVFYQSDGTNWVVM